ncbi:hypothetical protein AB0M47_12490 [Hamadaea sp. NPDC051192]|uniref:hypothetical protein n=1 Tax=Hamadaea sp. NPDC051192 TaxID=3154940 RepID=UPI00341DCBDA
MTDIGTADLDHRWADDQLIDSPTRTTDDVTRPETRYDVPARRDPAGTTSELRGET